MQILINSSRDKILNYALSHFPRPAFSVLTHLPDLLPEGAEVFFLAKPQPNQAECDWLKQNPCSLIISDGRLLTKKEDIGHYISIMESRLKARQTRLEERQSLIQSTPPLSIAVEPSYLCNLRCPHCHTGNKTVQREKTLIDVGLAKARILETRGLSENLLMPFEGEPFIYPNQTFELAKTAKDLFMTVDIASNGHFFTPEVIERILHERINSITVTVDGMSEETYRKYRVNGSLKKVTAGLKALCEAKALKKALVPHIRVQMIVMGHNEHEMTGFKDFAAGLGVDSCAFKTMNLIDFSQKEDWLPKNRQHIRERYLYEGKNDYQIKNNTHFKCFVPWESMVIDCDGRVISCSADVNGEFPKGKVTEQSLMEIWNSPTYQKMRQNLKKGIAEDPMCLKHCQADFGQNVLDFS